MPTAEVKGYLVSVYHLAPQISEAFLVFLVAGGKCYRVTSLNHLSDYALSLSLSACFLRTRFMMSFAKDKGQLQTPRPYSLCPKVSNTYGKLLSPNHRRSLPAAPHSDLSARQYKGLFQDMMFERLRDSKFFEDASEVIVQPLQPAQRRQTLWLVWSQNTPETV